VPGEEAGGESRPALDRPRRIHIRKLQLSEFRNFEHLSMQCDSRHIVLTGDNGAGKTNMLEALSFLSPGRGLRRATYEQVARAGGAGTWSVFAAVEGAHGAVGIGTGIKAAAGGPEGQRRVRIDAAPARTSDVLLEHLRIVWLTPAMDDLFTGPAAERRKFLDRLVLAINPGHGRDVNAYERAMRSRNRLLAQTDIDTAWLDAIETQMTAAAASVHHGRSELLALLRRLIERSSQPNSLFPDAGLTLDGGFGDQAYDISAVDLEQAYRQRLAAQRRTDAVTGRTTEGPHRADLHVVHIAKAMPARQCSTGEQKALLLGLLLAHALLVREMSGQAPILLLDEIAAHLDSARRSALFDRIDSLDAQAWMTGTDQAMFDELAGRASYWRVAGGGVTEA
jgi:DNA replication and repair protein RecF